MSPVPDHGCGHLGDVDRLFSDVAIERARRDEELRAARDKLVAAETRRQAVQTEVRLELTELAAAAETELARMEEIHRRAVDAITSAAAQLAAEIVAACAESSDRVDPRIRPPQADR